GEKISPKTRFNIASISKQFTVVGALRLVDQSNHAATGSLKETARTTAAIPPTSENNVLMNPFL
ncbi:MAG: serine hydrolase, partial [Clostridia bacterium]|nr:serine hydrolase [Clostridia bacterium]